MTWPSLIALAAFLALVTAFWRWTKWKDGEAFAAVDEVIPAPAEEYSFTGLLDDLPADETQRIPGAEVLAVADDLDEHVEDPAGETLFIPQLGGLVYGRHSKCREKVRHDRYEGRHHLVGVS